MNGPLLKYIPTSYLIIGDWNNGTCKNSFVDLFPCKWSNTCIEKFYKCDGHIQCPRGEDEALEECKNTFPKEANFQCKAISEKSATPMEIMAFRNDGVKGVLISEGILVFVLFSITICSSNKGCRF